MNIKDNDPGIGNGPLLALGVIFLIALCIFVWSLFVGNRNASYDAQYQELAGELRVEAQQVASTSRLAISGDGQAFEMMNASVKSFEENLGSLNNGKDSLPSPKDMLGSELGALSRQWQPVQQ